MINMKTKPTALFILCLLTAGMASAQRNDAARARQQQWEVDLSYSNVGINFQKTRLGDNFEYPGRWTGLDVQLGPLVFGYSQGMAQTYHVRNELLSTVPELSAAEASHSYYFGFMLPIRYLTFGEFKTYRRVFRGHPIWEVRAGGMRMGPSEGALGAAHSAWQFTLSPGYRIRFPYASVDIGLDNRFNVVRDGYLKEAKTYVFSPRVTLRLDGLMDAFSPFFVNVDATQVSASPTGSSSTSSTRNNADGSRTVTTTTTNYYQVSTKPTSVAIADIGVYRGIGVRAAHSTIGVNRYSNNGALFGVNALFRKRFFVGGLNVEGGRIGHATQMTGTDPDAPKHQLRKPDRSANYASGSLVAVNALADVGLDLNSMLLALLGGIIMDDHDATSFLSLNAGYSGGYSVTSGQQFDDPVAALARLDRLRDNNRYNDARESGSGYVGGWFLSCDIGNVSASTQWYRYKQSPLANGLMISAAYRFSVRK